MADYAENLFQSIDIITKKQLESLSFDMTIEATITDASKAKDGEYIVSNGNSTFRAYSTETGYKKNDAVMVTVPQGNYDKQKMIIGKQVDDTNTPMVYKSPFQQLVNVSNNLISGEHAIAMYANSEKDYNWNDNIANFTESKAYATIENNVKPYLIWQSEELGTSESRFTRLGLKAQFSTWLNEYNTSFGNYGLAVVLIFSNSADNQSGYFGQIITFDSSEFFGDVYNFETYYTQEALFDISEFVDYPLKYIQLYAYQRNNFKDANGERIYESSEVDGDNLTTKSPNIFIKDPYICLGIPTSEFNADSATIVTDSSSTYQKLPATGAERLKNNQKILNLRWIHKDAKTGNIATVLQDELPANYHVYWYRYKLGAPSPDLFAGAHWERFYGGKNVLKADGSQAFIDENEEYNLTSETGDTATDSVEHIIFYPNVNRQLEQIKAIIVKEEQKIIGFSDSNDGSPLRMVATTPIIEFRNDDNISSQVTMIEENALSIKFNDESNGNYFLYNRADKISKEEYCRELKTLTAVFDTETNDVYKKRNLTQPYTYIKWIFPVDNTMIIPSISDDPDSALEITKVALESNGNKYPGTNGAQYTIRKVNGNYEYTYTRSSNDDGDALLSVGYFIKPNLNRNANRNTISLEINKDGQTYLASISMRFGTAGTSGSDYTIAVEWVNDNAFDISKGILAGRVHLYDQAGQEVNIESPSAYQYSWYKVREAGNDDSNKSTPEIETNELYYPVKNNALQSLIIDDDDESSLNSRVNYLITPSGATYYSYNPESKTFSKEKSITTADSARSSNKILYQKVANQKKLSFKAFKKVSNASQGTGLISKDYATFTYDNKNKKAKAFIKHNNIYVIDPWDQYYDNETYYYPTYTSNKNYNNTFLKINKSIAEQNLFSIERTDTDNSLSINTDLYILQITLTNFGDYDLVARFPIPLKNGDSFHDAEGQSKYYVVDYIEGPTEVRYSTDGETDFNKNPFQIVFRTLNWKNGNVTYDIQTEKKKYGHWELVCEESGSSTFLPNLIEYYLENNVKKSRTTNCINPLLQPPGTYFSDTPIYGVRYVLDKNIIFDDKNKKIIINTDNIVKTGSNRETRYYIEKGTTLWSQPIYSYQDNYPSTTLNKWNGKDIETNEDQGTIVANGFAAGKKEKDNTFTGVVLGDWSRTDTDKMITKQTGVYGFNHGAMSYALKDDGTAFFGKEGSGRIYFNGNKAQIYSANWTSAISSGNNYKQKNYGMMLDIDDGKIDIRNENHSRTTQIEPGLLKIIGDNKVLMQVDSNDFYLQSKDYSSNGNGTGVRFDLKNGKLTGYTFKIQAGSGGNKLIIDSSNTTKPLSININKFYVQWDGYLFSSYGKIGGWNIDSDSLTYGSGNLTIGLKNNLIYAGGTFTEDSEKYHQFQVNTSGQLIARNAKIKGKIEATSGTIGNWQILNDRLQTTDDSVYLSTSMWNFKNNFIVNSNGYLTAQGASISGTISTSNLSATGGTIGGWTINSGNLSGGTILAGNITASSGKIGAWEINSGAISNGATTLQAGGKLSSTNADITGRIVATSGNIGAWEINGDTFGSEDYGVYLNNNEGSIRATAVAAGTFKSATTTGENPVWWIDAGGLIHGVVDIRGQLYIDNKRVMYDSSTGNLFVQI